MGNYVHHQFIGHCLIPLDPSLKFIKKAFLRTVDKINTEIFLLLRDKQPSNYEYKIFLGKQYSL